MLLRLKKGCTHLKKVSLSGAERRENGELCALLVTFHEKEEDAAGRRWGKGRFHAKKTVVID